MARTVKHDEKLNAFWGEEDHLQVSQERSFSEMIFEMLAARRPNEDEKKIFELILNLSIDHGSETPSAKVVIEAANKGSSISEAVAEGIKEITDTHGGAIEPAMRFLYQIVKEQKDVAATVKEYLDSKKLIGGFGHRIYTVDPRAQLILSEFEKTSLYGRNYVELARKIEKELESIKGRKLPLNIDGAIAVVLCGFGWDPKMGKAVFIIARTPGLCAQYLNASN